MAPPSRMLDRIGFVTSKLKESAYGTPRSDANLQAGKQFSPNAPIFMPPQVNYYNNLHHATKQHDYPSEQREVERNRQGEFSFDADTWLLAFFNYYAKGKVTSVQPNAGGNPTAWRHTIEPQDPAADGKDLPTFTMYNEWANAAAAKRRLHSIHIARVGIEFPPSGVVQISGQLVGSGQETTGALSTPPALPATLNLLHSNDMVFKRGTQGSPPDVTSEIIRGSVKYGFTWNFDEENSRHAGSGLFMGRCWVGEPELSLEWQQLIDDAAATGETNFLAQAVEEVLVTVPGAQIGSGPEKHQLEIRALAARAKIVDKMQVGKGKSIYSYRVGRADAFKEGSNKIVTVAVQNLETSYGV